jgi:hypothetical protein
MELLELERISYGLSRSAIGVFYYSSLNFMIIAINMHIIRSFLIDAFD